MTAIRNVRQVLLATLLISVACTPMGGIWRGKPGTPAVPPPSSLPPSMTPNPAVKSLPVIALGDMSDANIAAILFAANNTDISYARLAPSRAQSEAVKSFAAQMLEDHTAVNHAIENLLTKIDLTPEDNRISLDFRDESANKRDILRELEGRAFDSTYIANEVSYHVKLLSTIDTQLLPTVRNTQFRLLITNIRPAVAGHLAHARQIQATMMASK